MNRRFKKGRPSLSLSRYFPLFYRSYPLDKVTALELVVRQLSHWDSDRCAARVWRRLSENNCTSGCGFATPETKIGGDCH